MGRNHYDVLGLTIDATREEIRSAYFDAARRLHPDVNPDPSAKQQFLEIQNAYEVLSNASQRGEYDHSLDPACFAAPEITVVVRKSRNTLPLLREPQMYYLLVDLLCTAETSKAQKPPAHICMVIDRSTSMSGARMEMVKANVSQAVKNLKSEDMVSVVAFGDRAEVVIPPTRMSAFSKMENRIYAIQTGGGTEIYQGLLTGLSQLRSASGPEILRQLILMTDGHTYGDEAACLKLAEDASIEGIGITALGIGHEWNDQFLDQLTAYSGGSTTYINNPKDLARALDQKIDSVGAAYASGITLHFPVEEKVKLQYAFRLRPEITPLPVETPLVLGNLGFGKSMSLLLEFKIDPLEPGTSELQILNGKFYMEIAGRPVKKNRVTYQVKAMANEKPDPEQPFAGIVEALSRLTLFRMQERARQEVSQGNVNRATKSLQYLATRLLARGDQDLAHTVLVEAEHIRQSQMFSKDGDKRIKYGTRALLLPPGPEYTP